MTDLTLISLPYGASIDELCSQLVDLPGFVVLESGPQTSGRYDLITAMPYDEMKVMPDDAVNLTQACEALAKKLALVPSRGDCPFQGGAIGYVTYDLGAREAGVYSTPHPPLAHLPLMHMRFYDWAIMVDHHQKTTQLMMAHHQKNTPKIVADVLERIAQARVPATSFQLTSAFRPLMSTLAYQRSFAAIHEALRQGRVYQVNFTQMFSADYRGDAWAMYQQIREKNPVPFSVFWRDADVDLLSFSPERLLLMDDRRILTSPIKGTQRRSADPLVDAQLQILLQNSAKNRAENIMIVDLLRNDLGRFAEVGSVSVTSLCELMSFTAVHHLVSHIEAMAPPKLHPVMAFANCFPGGSITGAPKREAMRIIGEQEPFGRGVYCGSMGYFSLHGRMDLNIAIRTITATPDQVFMAAGGGIVFDSDCEEEYRECYIKIQAILRALGLDF